MASLELQTERPSPEPAAAWRGSAFGLTLESAEPFPGLPPVEGAASGRVTAWREERASAVDKAWRPAVGEVLLDLRHSDGRQFLRIDAHEPIGFRIWAPYYGRHLVSTDGSEIASALPRVEPARWQRLFFAQVLPLAAVLSGLSALRASAVAVGGHVLAFVGPPTSGKTSFAAHLVALGASFVTDDVLAIEKTPDGLVAYPGPARLNIDEAELRRVPLQQQERLGPIFGRSDKLMLEPTPVSIPLPLACVYVLRPGAEGTRIEIVERESPSSRSLLESGFPRYLSSAEHRQRLLDVCAALSESVPLYAVELPDKCRARDVAARVLAHCEALCGALRL